MKSLASVAEIHDQYDRSSSVRVRGRSTLNFAVKLKGTSRHRERVE